MAGAVGRLIGRARPCPLPLWRSSHVRLSAKVPTRNKDVLPTKDKPPTLILHGLLGSASNWRSLMARTDLFQDGQYVAAIDLRNHGASGRSDSMKWEHMCADVLEFSRELGVDSAHLIGHSMGGKVAMMLALMYPERVSSLVIVDIAPAAYGSTDMHRAILDAMHELDLGEIDSVHMARQWLVDLVPDTMTREFVLTNLVSNHGGDTALKWKVNLDALRASLTSGDLTSFEPPEGGIYDGPCLFVRGSESKYIREEHAEPIAELFPNSVTKTIEGAGHWIHHQKPEQFVRVLRDWYGQNT